MPEEKQRRIVNAAMEVFAKNEYKRASTDDIAARAGISKGLLFHYFGSKKELYFYLYRYVEQMVAEQVTDKKFAEITDFFEMMAHGAEKKLKLVAESPYLMEFTVRLCSSRDEGLAPELDARLQQTLDSAANYFKNIDFSRFRPGVDPMELLRMLTWMTLGYLEELRRRGLPVEVDQVMRDYQRWSEMFRSMAYKEEYL
nr:TetR/AcrR family transcriptional regulator [Anaerofilum hominis]